MKPKISEKEYDYIIQLYDNGCTKEYLQNLYGVSNTVIDRIFKIKNHQFRDDSHKRRIYDINENYFDEIDSPDKAYILGLLFADGCNSVNTNTIKIELQERDKSILDEINKKIGSNRKLTFHNLNDINSNWQNTYLLSFTNKHMSKTLCDYGMVANKSLILKFPLFINDEKLLLSFICGYFDGDGHIEWRKTAFLTIASSFEFCSSLSNILSSKFNIDSKIYYTANKESNTRVLHIFKKPQIYKFLNLIYSSSTMHINRKYNTYLKIHNEIVA